MANISASMVKELRDMTGAGMMDCKTALSETGGDMQSAVDWLRTKGLAKAAKKAGRVAAEGLIGVATGASSGALIEVNSETDFVARNDEFKAFVKRAAEVALKVEGDMDQLLAHPHDGEDATVSGTLTALIAKIGENMSVRRASVLAVDPGIVASYVHNAAGPELGKIGVLVALSSTADRDALAQLGRQIAMHVAAASPIALSSDHVPAEIVERERAIYAEQARESGKPESIIAKMVDGRMKKFFQEQVLLEQTFVIDGETPISKVIEKAAKDLGQPITLTGFVRYQVGEGIEKEDSDFAGEVSKMAGH
ncbi:MAG: elongation factor Ts [Alphaproteobacteria bacterium]|nr:elongation factor Ts [Alphaproteobacteria bacterium]